MENDKAVRARVAGKQKVQAATRWTLEVGDFKFRCVEADGKLRLECRGSKGWELVGERPADSTTPRDLLQTFLDSQGSRQVLPDSPSPVIGRVLP